MLTTWHPVREALHKSEFWRESSLRSSACLCDSALNHCAGTLNAEYTEIRRGPQRKRFSYALFVQRPSASTYFEPSLPKFLR
jgi:hypothetical protein